ncbi:MAG: hypothetical protein JWP09_82 [Candidatus Taylorbacteria bacterium]|nr:hypothetical protein [Candidatus Taylorbacteria bacterium]
MTTTLPAPGTRVVCAVPSIRWVHNKQACRADKGNFGTVVESTEDTKAEEICVDWDRGGGTTIVSLNLFEIVP